MSPVISACRCSATGGINTFQHGDLQHLYAKLHEEGLHQYLFADGTVQSFSIFEQLVTQGNVWCYIAYGTDNKPVAVALLDTFKGKTAHMHFAFFHGYGQSHRYSIAFRFLSALFKGGLTAVFGCTSLRWRNVRTFAREVGFVEVARIPGYHEVLNRRTGEREYHDTMLSVCTPETLSNKEVQ